ncbi:hypothetical protein Angca_001768, partial [Angiostrongylus cantonensis]
MLTNTSTNFDENLTEPLLCLPSAFVDQDVLLRFVRSMDYFVFCSAAVSSLLQIDVLKKASRHVRRNINDQCLHVFLLSMTMGDFILTAVCYPIEAISRMLDIRDEMPIIVNVTVHFLTWVALSGSSLSLILLNVDKLLYFKYPLRYSSYVKRSRGIMSAFLLWSCCVLFVAAAWYFECFECEDNCSTIHLLRERWGMYLLFSVAKLQVSVCVMPTLTSLIVAIYIVKIVSSHRKRSSE